MTCYEMDDAKRRQRVEVAWQLLCEAVLHAMESAEHDTWPQQLADETPGLAGKSAVVKAVLFDLRERGAPLEYFPERGGMWRWTG